MKSLLFVCSGNTCRSPLAEALTRAAAVERGVEVEVSSAGIMATEGAPASPGSVRAANRRGADLSRHRARRIDERDVQSADLVLVMTPAHLAVLRAELGRELDAVLVTRYLPADHMSHGRPVADPFGGGEEQYEEVARLLEECVRHVLDRLAGTP